MEDNDSNELKEEILKELVKKKEEIDEGILESIRDLKKLLTIEYETGKVIILERKNLKNKDKLVVIMLGKYLAYKACILDSAAANIQTLSDETGILKTTLSAPLGELVRQKILIKQQENTYALNGFLIKEEAEKLLKKIENGE